MSYASSTSFIQLYLEIHYSNRESPVLEKLVKTFTFIVITATFSIVPFPIRGLLQLDLNVGSRPRYNYA